MEKLMVLSVVFEGVTLLGTLFCGVLIFSAMSGGFEHSAIGQLPTWVTIVIAIMTLVFGAIASGLQKRYSRRNKFISY